MAFLVAVGNKILGNSMHIVWYKTGTYLQANYMEQGPLEADSFIASPLVSLAAVTASDF